MQNRLTRRRKLASDKLRLLVNVLLILVVAGVNFEVIPNINTYINSSHLSSSANGPQVKASFTNQSLTQYHGKQTVIQVEPNNHRSWRQSENKYLRLEINSADNARNFANNMDSSASYLSQQLQHSNLSPKQVKLEIKNEESFEQYGYNLTQFSDLLSQNYYGNTQKPPAGTILIEKIMNILTILIMVISLVTLVYLVFMPKEKIKRWL